MHKEKSLFRSEKDALGVLKVPKDAYYGIHTQRSLQNFQISSLRWDPSVIAAIAYLKIACAKANTDLKLLTKKKADAIIHAAKEVAKGSLDDHIPLDIFQAGSGTSTNMNVNEVIASRGNELLGGTKGDKTPLHPNDDVNKGQSTNNVIPSAIRVASALKIPGLIFALQELEKSFKLKAKAFEHIIKSARTHLQDAVPITLGQEFNAYATMCNKHHKHLRSIIENIATLGIGGNAVGTGINTKKQYKPLIIKHLNQQITHPAIRFTSAKDGIEATQNITDIALLSANLKTVAIDINKMCNDLRLLSSGPNTGFHEINLPAVEPGSSIMPGKINPSICEATNMVCHQVIGNDTTIALSATSGNLNFNTHMPVIGHNIIESLTILTNALLTLNEKCISGITSNEARCTYYFENSLSIATLLNPILGYDKASEIVKEAKAKRKKVKDLLIEKKLLTPAQVKKLFDPTRITSPQ